MKSNKKSILVICAHSDDQIFGCGGTMIKYSEQGYDVHTIIMSFGEKSNPLFKEKITIKKRVQESKKANKIVGGKDVLFFGLKEGKFKEDAEEKKTINKLSRLIKKYDPEKIFTHSNDDPHKDHRDTYSIVIDSVKKINYKGGVYSFEIWNIFNLKKRELPKLYINITGLMEKKLNALKSFESQKMSLFFLTLPMIIKSTILGLGKNMLFAEIFYRVY